MDYPLTLPPLPGFTEVEVLPFVTVGLTESPFEGSQQVQLWDREGWQFNFTLPPLTAEQAAPWRAFLLALRGKFGTFLAAPPLAEFGPFGSGDGAPVAAGAHVAGATLLHTSGWSAGAAGVLVPGDYFQLGEGATSRLHTVVSQSPVLSADEDGLLDIEIFPRLRGPLANGDVISMNDPLCLLRLASNSLKMTTRTDFTTLISFAAVEAL